MIILLLSVIVGSIAGLWLGNTALLLKPFYTLFLNSLFTVVIPLVFFSVASSAASNHINGLIKKTTGVFVVMGLIAAIYMLIVMTLFPLTIDTTLPNTWQHTLQHILPPIAPPTDSSSHLFDLFTVSDFPLLFSRDHLLALMIFAFLLGHAASSVDKIGEPVRAFLQSGMAVCMKLTSFVMLYAPVGFAAYFAVFFGQYAERSEEWQALMGIYGHISTIYYIAGLFYFFMVFSIIIWLIEQRVFSKLIAFWKNCIPLSVTALTTCSSAACMPVNLKAAENMGIRADIYNTVIPLGTILHKQGSILGGIVKIVFLFSFFHWPLNDISAIFMALGVAILVGTVMGAIPSGGMLGEMLIISVYGFPPEALMLIAVISMIIDPLATVLNTIGNTISSLWVDRLSRSSAT